MFLSIWQEESNTRKLSDKATDLLHFPGWQTEISNNVEKHFFREVQFWDFIWGSPLF